MNQKKRYIMGTYFKFSINPKINDLKNLIKNS